MKLKCLFTLGLLALAACSGDKSEFAVSVTRGSANEPIIRITGRGASSLAADKKLFETEGYVTAQDRFVQMDLLRRSGLGTTAEVLGASAAAKDRKTIGVGLPWAIQKSDQRMHAEFPEAYELLQAYADGVNKYLREASVSNAAFVRLYLGITGAKTFLSDPPQPTDAVRLWQPSDSIAIGTTLGFYLSSAIKDKVSYGVISQILSGLFRGNEFRELLDLRPIENTFILGMQYKKKASTSASRKHKSRNKDLKFFAGLKYNCVNEGFPFPDCGKRAALGSNNWVVSKEFTNSGATLLANDTHLPLTLPSTFYMKGLNSREAGGSIHVQGVTPPGIPGVLIGHNEDIGWGSTNLSVDVDDVYIEEMNEDHTQYKLNKQFHPVEVVKYSLKIRTETGGFREEPIVLKFIPEHGPLFSEHVPEVGDLLKIAEQKKLLGRYLGASYRWTGHRGSTEFAAVLGLNRSRNFGEFKEALNHFEAGAQNIVYADKDGNIGYYGHAMFPIRKYLSTDLPPYTFVQGSRGNREWEKEFRSNFPEAYKQQGYIVTANNDPYGHSYYHNLSEFDDYLSFTFSDGIRAARITELLDQKKREKGYLTAQDMQAIQYDHKDVMAMRFIDLIKRSRVREKLSSQAQAMYDEMVKWQASGGLAEVDQTGPVPFYEWMHAMMKVHFAMPEPLFGSLKGEDKQKLQAAWDKTINDIKVSSPMVKTLYHKLADAINMTDSSGGMRFDLIAPEVARDRAVERIRSALELTAEAMRDKNLTGLTWGSVNTLKFANPLEGILPAQFVLPIERPGAFETVDCSGPGFGPNFRMVLSLKPGEPITASMVVPGGNFAPTSTKGLMQTILMWRNGQTAPMNDF